MNSVEHEHMANLISDNLIPAVKNTAFNYHKLFYWKIDKDNSVEIDHFSIIFKGKYKHVINGCEEEQEFEKERLEEIKLNQWSQYNSNHLIFNYENILPFATALITYLKEFEAYKKQIRDVIAFAEGIGTPTTKFVIIEKFKNDFTTAQ
jgi:hypothetical protein